MPRFLLVLSIVGWGLISGLKAQKQTDELLSNAQQETNMVVMDIILSGNKVTKDFIMMRELEFNEGDTIAAGRFKLKLIESKENLLNTSLFNFVTITGDTLGREEDYILLNVRIDVIERWYIWPFPIFEFADRNFNAWWKDKDFSKVNYGGFLEWDNFRGRKEVLKLLLRFGYDEKYQLYYEIPYINRKKTIGLGVGLDWSQSHEISYRTMSDTLQFFKAKDSYPRQELKLKSQLIYRPDIHNTHYAELSYSKISLMDTVLMLNPQYSAAGETDIRYFAIYYKYKSDFRDYAPYPLEGYYFDVILNKFGLGLIRDNDLNVFTLQSTFRKYWKLAPRWYFASLFTSQFSSKNEIPYMIQSGLGYHRVFVRGYELYVIDGQKYGLFRSNIKFALVPTRVFNINFIKTQRFSKIHYAFYLNLFFDAGYAQDDQFSEMNRFSNQFLYGTGIGLDFVTYYDMVFRLEWSMNKQHETGIFIHFMAPI
ncbi:MAG: hypothetical protein K9G67_00305 [Bacteroidales bacterium]|nr:hypothetical protein [Bacteroidales bacterium]MCF8351429.1 hypothetical protein [Bacteroidales bacterium]MCF8374772.1 hypothetical protein [Bacteroidales bacterium]MCF8399824.1 hypothetical protein [Bacteroidales bacterium]